eukprot:3551604-Prymnesium_polylepis.1
MSINCVRSRLLRRFGSPLMSFTDWSRWLNEGNSRKSSKGITIKGCEISGTQFASMLVVKRMPKPSPDGATHILLCTCGVRTGVQSTLKGVALTWPAGEEARTKKAASFFTL